MLTMGPTSTGERQAHAVLVRGRTLKIVHVEQSAKALHFPSSSSTDVFYSIILPLQRTVLTFEVNLCFMKFTRRVLVIACVGQILTYLFILHFPGRGKCTCHPTPSSRFFSSLKIAHVVHAARAYLPQWNDISSYCTRFQFWTLRAS